MKKTLITVLTVAMLLNTSAPITTLATTVTSTVVENKEESLFEAIDISDFKERLDYMIKHTKDGKVDVGYYNYKNDESIDKQVALLKETITYILDRNKAKTWNWSAGDKVNKMLDNIESNFKANPRLYESGEVCGTLTELQKTLNSYSNKFVSNQTANYKASVDKEINKSKAKITTLVKSIKNKDNPYDFTKTISRAGKLVWAIYGDHNYGCDTQEEYNAVMTKIYEILTNETYMKDAFEIYSYKGMQMHYDGKKLSDFKEYTPEFTQLNTFLSYYTNYHNTTNIVDRISEYDCSRIVIYTHIFKAAATGLRTEATTYSAYQTLFGGKGGDCDAYAQLQIAYWDALGYNTALLGEANHAGGYVQFGDSWYSIQSGGAQYRARGLIKPLRRIEKPTKGLETLDKGWDDKKVK